MIKKSFLFQLNDYNNDASDCKTKDQTHTWFLAKDTHNGDRGAAILTCIVQFEQYSSNADWRHYTTFNINLFMLDKYSIHFYPVVDIPYPT